MPEKVESWADYQAGYRQAICDIIPDPNERKSCNGVLFAYLIGLILVALILYTQE